MREILFRGKRTGNGEWVIGGIMKTFHPNYDCENEEEFLSQSPNCYCICANNKDYFVEQASIGQYTGLTDKNGKKIFEGDIVKVTTLLHYRTSRVEYYDVSWDDMHYGWQPFLWGCGHCDPLADAEKSEVVGNIYDNNLEDFAGYYIDHTEGAEADAR